MHSYTMRARDWTAQDYGLATFDVGTSMLVAFGIYSLAIFLVAAGVLHSPTVEASELSVVAAAQALGPLVGTNAKWLFLLDCGARPSPRLVATLSSRRISWLTSWDGAPTSPIPGIGHCSPR